MLQPVAKPELPVAAKAAAKAVLRKPAAAMKRPAGNKRLCTKTTDAALEVAEAEEVAEEEGEEETEAEDQEVESIEEVEVAPAVASVPHAVASCVQDWNNMTYKSSGAVAVRQRLPPKKNIFQLVKTGDSHARLLEVCNAAIDRLRAGQNTEANIKEWCCLQL